ncbi:MAG: hypothetical protein COZ49_04190, partial [Candidatus Yonathbacteria bacterium CG_4_10_14_3_um_filter_47_65]
KLRYHFIAAKERNYYFVIDDLSAIRYAMSHKGSFCRLTNLGELRSPTPKWRLQGGQYYFA